MTRRLTRRLITNAGEVELLSRMLRQDGTPLAVRLIAVDFAPSQEITLADLTAPAFGGYTDAALDDSDWTVDPSDDGRAVATGIVQQWSYTLGEDVVKLYGACIYVPATDLVVSLEQFDDPVDLTGSSTVEFTPRIQLYDTADAITDPPPSLF